MPIRKSGFVALLCVAAIGMLAYAAQRTIVLDYGETLHLGDIDIVAPPPCVDCPEPPTCPDCPVCPDCPPEQPPPDPDPIPVPDPDPQPDPDPIPVPTPTDGVMTVGVNLPGPDDWNGGARSKIFIDVMKTARCISGATDASGWPTGMSTWRVLTTSNNQVQSANWDTFGSRQPKVTGTYKLSYDGSVAVTAAGASVKNVLTSGGKTTADIIVSSNMTDVDLKFIAPVRNIKLIRPGYAVDTKATTTNEFINYVAPFSYIRVMDLQITNWADEADAAVRLATLGADGHMDWSERPRDDYATYNTAWGVPIEALVRMANETGKNLWICIPWCATDNYLSGLANYLKANLNSNLHVVFEWGNETWNYAYGFYHSGLLRDEAHKYAVAGTLPALANPPDNDFYYSARYSIKRTIDASNIFRTVFGDLSRIHPTMSSQFANPSFVADALNWALRSYPNRPNYYLYGIACAPYYGASAGSVDNLLTSLASGIANRKANDSKLMSWRAIADAYQMKLSMYEAGCDTGQGTDNLANRIALGYDPRMQDTTISYLENCMLDSGATTLMYFSGVCTRDMWGPCWGLTDDVVDTDQPMYKGAAAFAGRAAPAGGLTAVFYKDSNFTTMLGTSVVPLVNHRWASWSTGGVYGRPDVTTTEARNGSIKFTGKYTAPKGVTGLVVEKEANDQATLTVGTVKEGVAVPLSLDYRAIFDGNGQAWVRLMQLYNDGSRAIVRESQLSPN